MNRKRDKKKRKRTSRYKQGFYKPINEDKYKQPVDRTMNKTEYPEYRSSWELAFYKFCDLSEKVEYWGTESFAIRYLSPKDNKVHRYYVDIVMKMKSGEKHLVEIKPEKQTLDPVNLAKFQAAEEYCKQIQATFTVVTEKNLKSWGMI